MLTTRTIAAVVLGVLASGKTIAHETHWSYTGESSPAQWGLLTPEYALCSEGKNQSPIDISTIQLKADAPAIKVNYRPTPLKVLNNGHTIQVNVQPGSSIAVGGKSYELQQFHFHSPSEHTIGGKSLDMTVHLVHKAANGQLAVIDVLLKEGKEHALIGRVFADLPRDDSEKNSADMINPAELLPGGLQYFNYYGSLTTPPCSEGVEWMVLSTPVEVGKKQVELFTKLFPHNARPVQPVNNRVVVTGGNY